MKYKVGEEVFVDFEQRCGIIDEIQVDPHHASQIKYKIIFDNCRCFASEHQLRKQDKPFIMDLSKLQTKTLMKLLDKIHQLPFDEYACQRYGDRIYRTLRTKNGNVTLNDVNHPPLSSSGSLKWGLVATSQAQIV